jgi:hypothetical protein
MREGESMRVIESRRYANESELQNFLLSFPVLIPLDDAEPDALPLLPIGSEVVVSSGFIDVLYIDASGMLTLAETKLKKNPEARREVVGQILEYAAALGQWSTKDVETRAETFLRCDSCLPEYKGLSFQEAMAKLSTRSTPEAGETTSVEDIRARIAEALRKGQLRLIIAVDDIHEQLRRTITYLNTYSTFQIYLLQLVRFEDQANREVFVPTLFGYAQKANAERPKGTRWDQERFFEVLPAVKDESIQEIVRNLYTFTSDCADLTWWGTGASEGSFSFYYTVNEVRVSVFTVTTRGHVWVNFGYMSGRVPDNDLERFRNELNAISGINLGASLIGQKSHKSPSIPLHLLSKPDNLAMFQKAVRRLGESAKSASATDT